MIHWFSLVRSPQLHCAWPFIKASLLGLPPRLIFMLDLSSKLWCLDSFQNFMCNLLPKTLSYSSQRSNEQMFEYTVTKTLQLESTIEKLLEKYSKYREPTLRTIFFEHTLLEIFSYAHTTRITILSTKTRHHIMYFQIHKCTPNPSKSWGFIDEKSPINICIED